MGSRESRSRRDGYPRAPPGHTKRPTRSFRERARAGTKQASGTAWNAPTQKSGGSALSGICCFHIKIFIKRSNITVHTFPICKRGLTSVLACGQHGARTGEVALHRGRAARSPGPRHPALGCRPILRAPDLSHSASPLMQPHPLTPSPDSPPSNCFCGFPTPTAQDPKRGHT